ncbi:MAG: helix-turn-helix transcriptional regulator [Alphaproteobacteria bacterium]|nr:helix-turn-helix transcriptional regulator [Alphaproteobacteria bacterium]
MDWAEAAGRLIDAIGAPRFGAELAAALRVRVGYDYTVIFGYSGSARPVDLFDDFPEDRRRLHVDEYQEGPYLLDPFYLATRDRTEPGLWRLSQLAPDRFYQGEYYRSYYGQTGLAEEVGFLIALPPDRTVVVSLMRKEKRFSNAEMRALTQIRPVVDAACRKHWSDFETAGSPSAPNAEDRLERAFQSFGEGVLTPREREVVELTLRGHSADAIGKLLGISSGTVRIHRRNIYSKLRISSQGELFNGFITALAARVEMRPEE